jgi:hypothetical protein
MAGPAVLVDEFPERVVLKIAFGLGNKGTIRFDTDCTMPRGGVASHGWQQADAELVLAGRVVD